MTPKSVLHFPWDTRQQANLAWQFRLAMNDLPLTSWLRGREDIRVFWMSCGGEK